MGWLSGGAAVRRVRRARKLASNVNYFASLETDYADAEMAEMDAVATLEDLRLALQHALIMQTAAEEAAGISPSAQEHRRGSMTISQRGLGRVARAAALEAVS